MIVSIYSSFILPLSCFFLFIVIIINIIISIVSLSFLYLYLTMLIVKHRHSFKIGFLDGNDKRFLARIRAHGNFSEYVPLILILMALAIFLNVPHYYLLLCVLATVIGRYAHAYGLLHSVREQHIRYRSIGMVLTLISIVLLSVYVAVIGVMMFIY